MCYKKFNGPDSDIPLRPRNANGTGEAIWDRKAMGHGTGKPMMGHMGPESHRDIWDRKAGTWDRKLYEARIVPAIEI